jgi:hypothetical protein
MTELQIESPLRFPEGWERTPTNATIFNAQFAQNVSITEAVRDLQDEITTLDANSATLYTNYNALINDRTRTKHGQSEGASLKLSVGVAQGFLACDKWRNVAQNIYALQLAVRHLRLFEEWGIATSEYMLLPFDLRKELRNGSTNGEYGSLKWMDILGLGATATLGDANAIYRQRAKLIAHDESALIELNHAIEQARSHLRS